MVQVPVAGHVVATGAQEARGAGFGVVPVGAGLVEAETCKINGAQAEQPRPPHRLVSGVRGQQHTSVVVQSHRVGEVFLGNKWAVVPLSKVLDHVNLLFLVDFVPEDAVIDLSEQPGPVFIGGNGHEPANIPKTFHILHQ